MAKTHIDGTECLEGTKRVPADFVPCCDEFDTHTTACAFDVRYEWWQDQEMWVIAIAESAGGGGVAISFCPHCSTQLAGSSKSGRWMDV